jgi:hypothetical protein
LRRAVALRQPPAKFWQASGLPRQDRPAKNRPSRNISYQCGLLRVRRLPSLLCLTHAVRGGLFFELGEASPRQQAWQPALRCSLLAHSKIKDREENKDCPYFTLFYLFYVLVCLYMALRRAAHVSGWSLAERLSPVLALTTPCSAKQAWQSALCARRAGPMISL